MAPNTASATSSSTSSVPRPTSDRIDIGAMNQWLQQLHDSSPVYVHPRLLSFKNGEMKANWADYFDGFSHRDILSAFLKANLGGSKMQLALCATWTTSWVGKKEEVVRAQGWHMWAMVLVSRPQGSGKSMLIWDCDLEMPGVAKDGKFAQQAKDLAVQSQRTFVDATKRAVAIRGLWVSNGGGTMAGQWKCVDATTRWLEDAAQIDCEGIEDADIPEDMRFCGAVEIGLNT